MATRDELYQALRNADAAGDVAGARTLAAYIKNLPDEATTQQSSPIPIPAPTKAEPGNWQVTNNAINKGIAGGVDTVLNLPTNVLNLGKAAVGTALTAAGLPDYAPELTPNPDLMRRAMTKPGFINESSEPVTPLQRILDTGGQFVGGSAVNPASSARTAAANIARSGLAGLLAGTTKETTGSDAAAFLAGAVGPAAASRAVRAVGNTARAVVDPFTTAGQDRIAQATIRKFAADGPTAVNAQEIVPGSKPTLAEATGNPGIAGLQRTVRDTAPNRFVEREQNNAEARSATFEGMAKDREAIESAINAREGVADPLYSRAFTAEKMRQKIAKDEQALRNPFSSVGLSGEKQDLATQGLRDLAKRPLFKQAAEDARKLAANKGVKIDDPLQSLEGLHYTKLALDDMLNPAAKTAMGRNASAAVMDMRNKLTEELAAVSPLYGAARQRFAEMSKPINEMEALQGLRLTDARGNITLAKVQNAIRNIETQQAAPGVNNAKAIGSGNLAALKAIRDDLLRQSSAQGGRSVGSNTAQNLATQNILANALPGKLGEMALPSNIIGQLGKLVYSGANDQIRSRLQEILLDPSQARLAATTIARLPSGTKAEKALQAVTQARILAENKSPRLSDLIGGP